MGVEDEREADVGRGVFGEEFVEEGGDGEAGGGGVEFEGALDGSIIFVPGGGLGDANQVFDGRVLPEAGVVDKDGFTVEEAGFPGGLERAWGVISMLERVLAEERTRPARTNRQW